ncbi:MAG: hypothetical protein ABIJ56_11880 [Pseudomonadota bacterium]
MLQTIKDAAMRYYNLFVNTDDEWNIIASENPGLLEILFPFSAMGFMLFLVSFVISYLARTFKTAFIMELLITIVIYIGPVAVFMIITSLLADKMQAARKEIARAVCLYSFAPAWIASVLYIVPVISFGWLWIILSLIMTSILFIKAAISVIGIPDRKKIVFIIMSIASLAVPMGLGFLIKQLWLMSKEVM